MEPRRTARCAPQACHLARNLVVVAAAFAAACSSASSSSPSGSSTSSNDLTASVGPIPLAPSQEVTKCVVMPLGNTEDVVLNGFDMKLAPGSHHLIAYLTTAAPTTAPYDCSPFTGVAFGSDVPIAFANAEDVNFRFPAGVAMDVPANANIKIEAHYINATGSAIQGHGQVTFHVTPKSSAPAYQAANFLAAGTTHISIPPNSSYSTGPLFASPPAGTHMVLVTTHEHRLGTRAQVWASAKPGDLSHPIADDKDWASPAWRTLAPQVDFDGTNGLSYQCDWTNTTDQTITFGESALDEMCIIAGYYYPSQGIIGCLGNGCKAR